MLRLVISFFALLGVLSVAWYLLGLFISGTKLVEDVGYEVFHSLDDRFVLVKSYSVVQGGALASNCQDSVFIFSSEIPVEEGVKSPVLKVYSGSCDVFSNGSSSPRVRWAGARGAEVEFAINGASLISREVTMKTKDFTGEVRVKFIISE